MFNSEAFRALLRRNRIVYVDAGARGDLEGDWQAFPNDCLSVLAFEPDETATIDWESIGINRAVERSALWSHEAEIDIHIGKIAATSSVWPPNIDYLTRFADAHVDPRRTQSVHKVRGRPLDAILAERGMEADFLKIDTQGAELQILQGAEDALNTTVIGAVVETWTVPIHAGQGLTHEVMELMYKKGFVLCQVETAAAWGRKIVECEEVSYRRQIVGLDLLFLRDPLSAHQKFKSPEYAAKYATIAQMYGHYDLALESLDAAIDQSDTDRDLLNRCRRDTVAAYTKLTAPISRPGLLRRIRNKLRAPTAISLGSPSKLHY